MKPYTINKTSPSLSIDNSNGSAHFVDGTGDSFSDFGNGNGNSNGRSHFDAIGDGFSNGAVYSNDGIGDVYGDGLGASYGSAFAILEDLGIAGKYHHYFMPFNNNTITLAYEYSVAKTQSEKDIILGMLGLENT